MIINNSICSINSYRYCSYALQSPDHRIDSLKSGVLKINGIKIKIEAGDTLSVIAEKINSKSYDTKVEAKIIKNGLVYRLLLQSKNREINIMDYNGVFLSLYKNRLLGINDNCLIQAIRIGSDKSNNAIILNYKYISTNHIFSNPIISGLNRFILSSIKEYFSNTKDNREVDLTTQLAILPSEIRDVNEQTTDSNLMMQLDTTKLIVKSPLSPTSLRLTNSKSSHLFLSPAKKEHRITPTKNRGDNIHEFNKACNYVFSRIDEKVRHKFGLTAQKEDIKFFPESELYKLGQDLTPDQQITKKLYEIYQTL